MFFTSVLVPSLEVAGGPDREVGIHPQASLLHAALADAGVDQDLPQGREIGPGLGRRPQVRLTHDLGQRGAGAVEVDRGLSREAVVQQLARRLPRRGGG